MLVFFFVLIFRGLVMECDTAPFADDSFCTCITIGNRHFIGTGGEPLTFSAGCGYTLMQSAAGGDAPCDFSIVMDDDDMGTTFNVNICSNNYRIGPQYRIKIGGINEVTTPYADECVTITLRGTFTELYSKKCGLKFKWDGSQVSTVELTESYRNMSSGLCGRCDGSVDYLVEADGSHKPTGRENEFQVGSSFRIPDDEPSHGCSESKAQDCISDDTDVGKCWLLRQATQNPFQACLDDNEVDLEPFYRACVYDVCVGSDDVTDVCRSLSAAAERCRMAGHVTKWRSESLCPYKCSENAHYLAEIEECPATCDDPYVVHSCAMAGGETCACNQGLVLSGTTCVQPTECGCSVSSSYYMLGMTNQEEECGVRLTCMKTAEGTAVLQRTRQKKDCGANTACTERIGSPVCVCKPGFHHADEGGCTLGEHEHSDGSPTVATTGADHQENSSNEQNHSDEETEADDGHEHSDTKHTPCNNERILKSIDQNESCVCCLDGHSHILTFDKQAIETRALCKLTLAQSFDLSDPCHFNIVLQTDITSENSTHYHIVFSIDFNLLGYTVVYNTSYGIELFNSGDTAKPSNVSDFHFYVDREFTVLTSPRCGVRVLSNGRQVYVVVPKTYGSKMHGICGNCDGEKNDFVTRDNMDLNHETNTEAAGAAMVDSYIVPNADGNDFCTELREALNQCTYATQELLYDDYCGYITEEGSAFSECLKMKSKFDPNFATKEWSMCKIHACKALHENVHFGAEHINTLETSVCQYFDGLKQRCDQTHMYPMEWNDLNLCSGRNSTEVLEMLEKYHSRILSDDDKEGDGGGDHDGDDGDDHDGDGADDIDDHGDDHLDGVDNDAGHNHSTN